jgi:hypothetical protein
MKNYDNTRDTIEDLPKKCLRLNIGLPLQGPSLLRYLSAVNVYMYYTDRTLSKCCFAIIRNYNIETIVCVKKRNLQLHTRECI